MTKKTNRAATKAARGRQLELQEQARILRDHFLSRNRASAKELNLIENALGRIEKGCHGICTRCAQPISPQRLRAIPWAECCVDCQDDSRGGMSVAA